MQEISENPQIPQGERGKLVPASWFFRMLDEGRRTLFFWVLQLVFWCGIGVLVFLMNSFFRPSSESIRGLVLLRMGLGLLMTCGLREIYRRPAVRQAQGWGKALVILGLCLAFALLEKPITQVLVHLHLPLPGTEDFFQKGSPVVLRFITLLVWSGFYLVFHQLEGAHALELRALRAEVAARENQLRHLQAQINPHFLFNALNTVLASKDDPKAVEEVTQGLADYLRFSMRDTEPLEPLGREIDALETYLAVQRIRFREKLVFQIQCETAARAVRVPPMMIQPLLENAFNYGGKTSPLPLHVKLSATLEQNALIVTVANTGQWVMPGGEDSTGIGIRSLRQRLELLIGKTSSVTVNADDGWVSVTIRIPLNANPSAALS
ncbi:MAG: histidine kinase [Akkermansiaceae bacterium]|nr:histidine kinase [Akkermansiaceae bacterium]